MSYARPLVSPIYAGFADAEFTLRVLDVVCIKSLQNKLLLCYNYISLGCRGRPELPQ